MDYTDEDDILIYCEEGNMIFDICWFGHKPTNFS